MLIHTKYRLVNQNATNATASRNRSCLASYSTRSRDRESNKCKIWYSDFPAAKKKVSVSPPDFHACLLAFLQESFMVWMLKDLKLLQIMRLRDDKCAVYVCWLRRGGGGLLPSPPPPLPSATKMCLVTSRATQVHCYGYSFKRRLSDSTPYEAFVCSSNTLCRFLDDFMA